MTNKRWEGKHWKSCQEKLHQEIENWKHTSNFRNGVIYTLNILEDALKKDWEEQQISEMCQKNQDSADYERQISSQKEEACAQTVESQSEKSGHQGLFSDEILNKVVQDIADNHNKIINDWCKAYMAQLYEEGVQIKPGNFTLNEQVPTFHKGKDCLVKKYWFEPGIPQFDDEKKAESFTSANWISVKDRLPENKQEILMTYNDLKNVTKEDVERIEDSATLRVLKKFPGITTIKEH